MAEDWGDLGGLARPLKSRERHRESTGTIRPCPRTAGGGPLVVPLSLPSELLHLTFCFLTTESGPREKRRPHRALKHSKGLVRSTERLGGAYGLVPPPEDCWAPGGALQSRSRTGGNCGEGGNNRLKHQWTDTDYGEGSR
ncbi:hypothetical protein NDU88_006849 [Pleurodeles waltl]|uniref:Uncharacterized protein n=1 Tax=Pleurodeles waltl TaxID=8319 RepID=A0AAV7TZP9_PLEWA|nr:hypothetical protein NDU88_006849 [Pleurodeles waltl]